MSWAGSPFGHDKSKVGVAEGTGISFGADIGFDIAAIK